MNTGNSVRWDVLLDSGARTTNTMKRWAQGTLSTRNVTDAFTGTDFAGPFRQLIRDHGTQYGRNLARKAMSYRAITV